jgi:DNA-binding GntR family transcriptional regulator
MLNHPNISDRIYDILCEQIISQKLRFGTRIKEEEVAQELGVSRTPLRDAINRLVKDGYLEAEPRKGARVTRFQIKDVEEVYDLRMALEGLAARLSASELDAEELKHLMSHFSEKVKDTKALHKADTQLHDLIIRNCGNDRLIHMLDNLYKLIRIFRLTGYSSPERSGMATSDHVEIIKAFLKRDANLAEQKVREHIRKTKEQILSQFEQQQEQSENDEV